MNIFRQANTELGSIRVVYESPVRMESADQKGYSHLLEHIISEALTDVEDQYDECGITSNAYTSGSEVVFYISGLCEELDKFRDDFVRRIVNYAPVEAHFRKQLPIVMQEYEDTFSNPHDAFSISYWSEQYGAMHPIGGRVPLESATFERICAAHTDLYRAPTKIMVVGKTPMNLDWVQFAQPKTDIFIPYTNTEPARDSPESSVLVISHSQPIKSPATTYQASMIAAMLSMGLRSPLMTQLREVRGLCYGLSFSPFVVGDQIGLSFETTVRLDKVDETLDAFRATIADPDSMTEARFNTVKANRLIAYKIADQRGPNETILYELERNNAGACLPKNLAALQYSDLMNYWHEHFYPGLRHWISVTK